MATYDCNPNIQELEIGESEGQGYPLLHDEFKAHHG